MYPLLDHEDFEKSRKALMATSAFLLLISKLQIDGSSIDLVGLKFRIDPAVVSGFATFFLLYFLYVFLIRAPDHYASLNFTRIKADVKEMQEKKINFTAIPAGVDEEKYLREQEYFSYLVSSSGAQARWFKRIVTIFVDLAPPIAIGIIALLNAGSYSAAVEFLFGGMSPPIPPAP